MSYRANKLFLPHPAMVKNPKIRSCDYDLWPWNSQSFKQLSRYMFVQNFIKLSAAVHELLCVKNNTVCRYSSKASVHKPLRSLAAGECVDLDAVSLLGGERRLYPELLTLAYLSGGRLSANRPASRHGLDRAVDWETDAGRRLAA